MDKIIRLVPSCPLGQLTLRCLPHEGLFYYYINPDYLGERKNYREVFRKKYTKEICDRRKSF